MLAPNSVCLPEYHRWPVSGSRTATLSVRIRVPSRHTKGSLCFLIRPMTSRRDEVLLDHLQGLEQLSSPGLVEGGLSGCDCVLSGLGGSGVQAVSRSMGGVYMAIARWWCVGAGCVVPAGPLGDA